MLNFAIRLLFNYGIAFHSMHDNDTTTIRASPTVATQWYKHHFHKAYVKKNKLMVGSYVCCVRKIAS